MTQRTKPRAKQLGVTDEDYARMLDAQGGGCAICGNPPRSRRLHVDHDHRTGKVRGLLCFRCNRGLPNYVTEEWLRRAYIYVTRGAEVDAPDQWAALSHPRFTPRGPFDMVEAK